MPKVLKESLNKLSLVLVLTILFFALNLNRSEPAAPTKIQSITQEEASSWKIFKSKEYHFSFNYPEIIISNFHFNEPRKAYDWLSEISRKNNNLQNGYQKSNYNVIFEVNAWKFDGTIEQFIDKNYLPETKGKEKQNIAGENLTGIRISNNDADEKANIYFSYNLFKNKDYIYNFAMLSDQKILIPGNSKLLDNIISTLRFY